MNNDQLDQLRNELRRESRHIEPVALGYENVQRRGRRRQHRGRAIVAAGAATCMVGLGVAVTQRGPAPHSVAVAGHASAATPTLSFRTVDGTVAYASAHFTSASGVTYALATAPGTGNNGDDGGQAIYRTSDGEHWTETTQASPWISDLAERDGVLYAVGTAPGAPSIDQVKYQVATSHNDGGSWTDTDLPFNLQPPSASVPLSRSSGVQIARGASSTVALLTEQFSPDLSALIAARAPGHPDAGTTETANGFDIVDYSVCKNAKMAVRSGSLDPKGADAQCTTPPTLGTISWSDIGVHGAADLNGQQMLVSSDGSHWDSVAAPSPASGWIRDLVATDDGYLLLADNGASATVTAPMRASTTLLHSTDARSWSPVAVPAGLDVQSIAGNRLIGTDENGALATSNDGGTTWNTPSTSALLPAGSAKPQVWSVDSGPLGFAAIATSNANPKSEQSAHNYLLFSADGTNWNTTDLATVGAPAGAQPMTVTVGSDHVGVDYGDSGANPGGVQKITTLLGTPQR